VLPVAKQDQATIAVASAMRRGFFMEYLLPSLRVDFHLNPSC
jgi:hypothetical protein